jgi:hypothetical protein
MHPSQVKIRSSHLHEWDPKIQKIFPLYWLLRSFFVTQIGSQESLVVAYFFPIVPISELKIGLAHR